ncbi:hypothetical protein C5E51_34460 [Nocardia nova]|uniref:DUF2690 domain-containing protein n=1 Tax=Nocardia nova TaxID=37330 RepID=UPI000CE9FCC5|nr:DUF2690 domain-containing protein [Nocardia nova]PPJ01220.1 hypothetical protein C5E51_34460 [Nocardia nova]
MSNPTAKPKRRYSFLSSRRSGRQPETSEKAADISPDSVAQFKEDLRALREQHSNPTFEAMAKKSRGLKQKFNLDGDLAVSKQSLNNAVLANTPLPTARTVQAFVLTLTNDRELSRKFVARCLTLSAPPGTDPGTLVAPAVSLGPNRWKQALLIVAALAVTNLVTGSVVWLAERPAPAAAQPSAKTGDNPEQTQCTKDAKVAASRVPDAQQHFKLEIIYSQACQAAWGRITRNDPYGQGNQVTVDIYRVADPMGASRQHAVEPDVESAFTTLIVRRDPVDRLCVTGSVSTGTTVEQAPDPLCL